MVEPLLACLAKAKILRQDRSPSHPPNLLPALICPSPRDRRFPWHGHCLSWGVVRSGSVGCVSCRLPAIGWRKERWWNSCKATGCGLRWLACSRPCIGSARAAAAGRTDTGRPRTPRARLGKLRGMMRRRPERVRNPVGAVTRHPVPAPASRPVVGVPLLSFPAEDVSEKVRAGPCSLVRAIHERGEMAPHGSPRWSTR
jgi:hypothetical protein